ncbi:hypothetical protein [Frondihabitans sp. Leaf304]|uniref:hypothetical protein n=1 Tax=Frondihabitans sp. Leaf304 TaxID=1736329 RepID=UPI0006F3531C|nr:hypothetical protein [Frondihabitans sp. Leaf304]KQQ27293.1 hypothetical protein ASF54_00210 [Frondihabitans sp. Leaf304]
MNDVVHFVLAGVSCSLTRQDVERRLIHTDPAPITLHAVSINGLWYPVGQALEVATGVDPRKFRSREARRHLAQFGFELQSSVPRR